MAGPPELSGIALLKPAVRRTAVEAAIAEAYVDAESVDLTYHPSRFDRARTLHVEIEGISDPLDSNGRENLVVSKHGDPDRKPLTVGLHMIVSIVAHPECEGHESLAGEHMGEAVYCDGSCSS